MSDPASRGTGGSMGSSSSSSSSSSGGGGDLDLSMIHDPDVRRALRGVYQQMKQTLAQHQMEIEALLQMMIEKHVGSLGEFKRHLVRLQQHDARSERLHEQIAGGHPRGHAHAQAQPDARTPHQPQPAANQPRPAPRPVQNPYDDDDDVQRPRRYTL